MRASARKLAGSRGGGQEDAGEDEVRLADALLLGRKTYEALSAIWSKTTGEFADRVNSMPKYVASTSLVEPLEWNATLITGDLVTEVRRLKAHHTGNLLSYGCGEFAFNLVVVPTYVVDRLRALVLGLGLLKLHTEGGLSCSIVPPS